MGEGGGVGEVKGIDGVGDRHCSSASHPHQSQGASVTCSSVVVQAAISQNR